MNVQVGRVGRCSVPAIVVLIALATPAVARTPGDAFQRHCANCHSLRADAPPGPGPGLHGVGGRRAAGGDFAYSRALRESNVRWNRANLLRFLVDPRGLVPGTSMTLPSVPRAEAEAIVRHLTSASTVEAGGGSGTPEPDEQAGGGSPSVARVAGNESGTRSDWLDSEPRVESEQADFRVVTVASGLELPWAMAFLPGGDVLITEKPGRVRRISQRRLGRLAFMADGTLLLSVGNVIGDDREAQNPDSAFGSILRFEDDGTIPEDNPFVGRKGADPRLFTYGHRNPQGMTLRSGTAQIWTTEHGPMGGDELNRLVPGGNYGWPAITYGRNYDGSASDARSALRDERRCSHRSGTHPRADRATGKGRGRGA